MVVTADEYLQLTASEQEVVSYVTAAINALEGFDTQSANFVAIISLFRDQPNFNNLTISTLDGDILEKGGTCDVCGSGSAISCVKAIKAYVDTNGSCTVGVCIKKWKWLLSCFLFVESNFYKKTLIRFHFLINVFLINK